MNKQSLYEELAGLIDKNIDSQQALNKIKREIAKKYNLKKAPTNIEILTNLNQKFKDLLKTKPSRTISGVAPVAVMTKPIPCPHGRCIMCPTAKNVPQSYTGKEPATRRAIRNKFHPYLQVFNRLEQYTLLGNFPDKIELIIMGGNFTSFPLRYQNWFIKNCFKAFNDFEPYLKDFKKFKELFELNIDKSDKEREKRIQRRIINISKYQTTLEKAQEINETASVRCTALCIESRPDYCKEKQINTLLKQGCTRVELGIQNINNQVLKNINRKHTVEDSIKSTQLLKDSLLKVGYHVLLGALGSSLETDLKMFKELFSNQDFKPDALKIYPCMVLKNTKLYELWKKGLYKPLTTEQATELIVKIKKFIPTYCRVQRIQRDIPTYVTEAGVDRTNLRQYIFKKAKCNCIRCREPRDKKINWEHVKLLRYDYDASNGKEIFLSSEDIKNNILLGFCRLRIPYKPFRKEITEKSVGIRELHVYGTATQIGKKGEIQHKGIGKSLIKEAEKIAKEEFDIKKMLIISSIGTKEYYKKLGYKKDGVYVSKII